ncbi:hypothetical protein NA56DRAFT_648198 [Hyaloscypha hepaticicola]|uniref:Uncharacterized protein n=1 Tax=Hyaloscypha hepaticicola TaxID=2082293 RepID=A0A2J6PVJ4_9HELO|nr:hypothetical protein NA56DRAFT_648198 [Hyaloscypha hepaticicola]
MQNPPRPNPHRLQPHDRCHNRPSTANPHCPYSHDRFYHCPSRANTGYHHRPHS